MGHTSIRYILAPCNVIFTISKTRLQQFFSSFILLLTSTCFATDLSKDWYFASIRHTGYGLLKIKHNDICEKYVDEPPKLYLKKLAVRTARILGTLYNQLSLLPVSIVIAFQMRQYEQFTDVPTVRTSKKSSVLLSSWSISFMISSSCFCVNIPTVSDKTLSSSCISIHYNWTIKQMKSLFTNQS